MADLLIPAGTDIVEFKLSFNGDNYFWIVDDFQLYNVYPSLTSPLAIGTYLHSIGYAYGTDSLRHPYKKDEIIAQFKPTATAADKDSIRRKFTVCVTQCLCNTLDKWNLHYAVPNQNPNATVYSVVIEEIVDGAKSKPKIESVESNYYQYDELLPKAQTYYPDATTKLISIPLTTLNSNLLHTKVAVLDTDIDYNNQTNAATIYKSLTEIINNSDENGNCLIDDVIVYNFIYPQNCSQLGNNNPNNNYLHGSHVTGIIRNSLQQLYTNAPPYICNGVNFLAVKTHDSLGIGTLFSTTCGVYYTVQIGAKVINCSWGYYAQDEAYASILRDAVLYANSKNALVVAAVGNDSILIQSPDVHFPSSYTLPNVVAVACINTPHAALSVFSNYSLVFVDIASPGENISSNRICGSTVVKSSTSMSALVVSAVVAWKYCNAPNSMAANIHDEIL